MRLSFPAWRPVVFGLFALSAASMQPVALADLPDFTVLAENYGPTVVNISTTRKQARRPALPKGFNIPDLPDGAPLQDFLRRFFGEEADPEERDTQSLGSGFILSDDGYVVTNFHVIKDAEEVIVRLSDRREIKAQLVGSDERSDLALLKIEASDLPAVRVGTSKTLKVGEWVLAIGSPFGFEHSVTAGIVSAIGRSLPSENYVPFIQTDVAINPGNSGGPLFNLKGEVIGVNSQIYSRTGGFMGLSFAIPIDVVVDVVDQLKAQGRVTRGWLGVLIQDVTRELAESFEMDRPRGALVARVLADSPAAAAGFQPGDIVLEFDGNPVERSSDLPPIVGRTPVDKKASVKLLRGGKARTLTVTIAELPEEDAVQSALSGGPKEATEQRLGLSVSDLTAEERDQLEVAENGVLVKTIGDGPAFQAGIRQGDVILMLNNEPVKDTGHFRQLAGELPGGRAVPILIQRRGNPLFLALRLPE